MVQTMVFLRSAPEKPSLGRILLKQMQHFCQPSIVYNGACFLLLQ